MTIPTPESEPLTFKRDREAAWRDVLVLVYSAAAHAKHAGRLGECPQELREVLGALVGDLRAAARLEATNGSGGESNEADTGLPELFGGG